MKIASAHRHPESGHSCKALDSSDSATGFRLARISNLTDSNLLIKVTFS